VCNTFPERLLGKTVEKETWEVKQKPGWHQADQDDKRNQTENRVLPKKKGEEFAWRSEAVNRLCEERYRVSQRLLFGPIF